MCQLGSWGPERVENKMPLIGNQKIISGKWWGLRIGGAYNSLYGIASISAYKLCFGTVSTNLAFFGVGGFRMSITGSPSRSRGLVSHHCKSLQNAPGQSFDIETLGFSISILFFTSLATYLSITMAPSQVDVYALEHPQSVILTKEASINSISLLKLNQDSQHDLVLRTFRCLIADLCEQFKGGHPG